MRKKITDQTICNKSINFFKRHEGLVLFQYYCTARCPTSGYGHLEAYHKGESIHPKEKPLLQKTKDCLTDQAKKRMGINQEDNELGLIQLKKYQLENLRVGFPRNNGIGKEDFKSGYPLTKEDAHKTLIADIRKAQNGFNTFLIKKVGKDAPSKILLTQEEYTAWVSVVFNIGLTKILDQSRSCHRIFGVLANGTEGEKVKAYRDLGEDIGTWNSENKHRSGAHSRLHNLGIWD